MQQLHHPYTNNDTLHHGHWGLFSLCTPLLSKALKDTPFLETPTPSNRTVFEPSVRKSHWISSPLHKTPMQRIFTLRFDFLFAQFPPPCHTMQGKKCLQHHSLFVTLLLELSTFDVRVRPIAQSCHFCFVVVVVSPRAATVLVRRDHKHHPSKLLCCMLSLTHRINAHPLCGCVGDKQLLLLLLIFRPAESSFLRDDDFPTPIRLIE